LLAIGSERYTPYLPSKQPAEMLTIANHVLGTGQLSLAKFLFITADDTNQLSTHHVKEYLKYVFERIDLKRDVHFHTNTTIDTLDYSGSGLNSGSKVVFAAYGDKLRELATEIPEEIKSLNGITDAKMIFNGMVAIQLKPYVDHQQANTEMEQLNQQLMHAVEQLKGITMLVVCDDATFVSKHLNNFLWVTFTRTNPSHDIHGVGSFVENKHWGCNGPLLIDARIKPHHAPAVELDPAIVKKTDRLFSSGGSLQGIL
jgi:4-hydroxy-3-polyprenylbenzoate decarboxylase